MSAELKHRIENAKQDVKDAQGQLDAAQSRLDALRQALVKQEHGIEVGCVVRCTSERNNPEYLVTQVDTGSWRLRLKGRKRKKNREFGVLETYVPSGWDDLGWEVVEPAPANP